ncbi:MAG: hypothetical protein KF832_12620 [Caldilineaceae bacterium]|nr:hypothetical protein [Caldilineaceae bacterium]
MSYVRQAWPVLEPATDYIHGWHVDVICEHLEAVTAGEIKNLIINIPPGMMKSLLVSVMWPTWDWIKQPHRRYLTAAYAQTLATRDALKSRRLLQSAWYQDRWGDRFQLTSDQNQKTRYENNKAGLRVALSVGGAVTGERGDVRILDDPHKADAVKSSVQLANDLEWLKTVWPTRKMSKESAEVVIMQRLHERDATGYLLKEIGGYEHLVLPMRYAGVPCFTSLGCADPRTLPDELLCPERYDATEVADLEKRLGDDAPGQLQQRPTAAGGGIFKKAWWDVESGRNRYAVNATAMRNQVIARWLMLDTAFKDKASNDFSACAVWELWTDYRLGLRWMWQARMDAALLPGQIETLAVRWNFDQKLRAIVIEDKGSGITSIQTLRMSAPAWLAEMITEFEPKGSKEYRARLASVWCERDCIQLPWPGEATADWYNDFLDIETGQLWIFPNSAHDDLVDTFTQGILYLENYIAEGWHARMGRRNHDPDTTQ